MDLPSPAAGFSPTAIMKTFHISRCLAGVCLAVFCLGTTARAQPGAGNSVKNLLTLGQSQPAATTPVPPSAPAPAASAAIPLPDVAARSEDLKRMLRSLSDQLPMADQLKAAKATLDEGQGELQSKQKEAESILTSTPSTLEIREAENYWRSKQGDTAALRDQLLGWANAAQSAMQQLQAQQPQWKATLAENKSSLGLGPTLEVIQQAVSDLQRLEVQAQGELRIIVNLQVGAATQDQLALDMLGRLSKARMYLDGRLFERDSLPLWQANKTGQNSEYYSSARTRLVGIRAFAIQTQGALTTLGLLLLLCQFAAYRLRLAVRHARPENPQQAEVLYMARHWVALGLLPPLLSAYLLAPLAPLPLVGLVILLSFIPILILLPPLVQPKFRLLLYCLACVYGLSAFVAWASFTAVHRREVHFAINLTVFALFAFLVRPRRVTGLEGEGRSHQLRVFGIRLGVTILGTSLVANLFGYVKLAQFLGILCFYSTFIAISMFTGARVFTRLLLQGIETPAAQQLAVVRQYRDTIARWGPRLLAGGGSLIWLIATLNLLGLSDGIAHQIQAVEEFHIAGGSASITLGGVLGFFFILLVGYAVSSAIRFLLREELLSRFRLSRGLPELIASTLHYVLLLLVFFFAVNAGGIELNKFTVLTGALGVGVGFGLQNIVNNFISGLILQFERPIHIGDILDVDGTTGTVTRIGIRSSTVKTFQGAEVIIPNGNFISSKVINWTLSSSLRRVEFPVGVAYGSNAKRVAKLLEQAATTHECVLTSPAPAVLFKEFGDSALNFELQFWVMQESNFTKVKSEVALTVMQLLDDAGIEIPFPQRDLRVRSVEANAAATLLSPNGSAGVLPTVGSNGAPPSLPPVSPADPSQPRMAEK